MLEIRRTRAASRNCQVTDSFPRSAPISLKSGEQRAVPKRLTIFVFESGRAQIRIGDDPGGARVERDHRKTLNRYKPDCRDRRSAIKEVNLIPVARGA